MLPTVVTASLGRRGGRPPGGRRSSAAPRLFFFLPRALPMPPSGASAARASRSTSRSTVPPSPPNPDRGSSSSTRPEAHPDRDCPSPEDEAGSGSGSSSRVCSAPVWLQASAHLRLHLEGMPPPAASCHPFFQPDLFCLAGTRPRLRSCRRGVNSQNLRPAFLVLFHPL